MITLTIPSDDGRAMHEFGVALQNLAQYRHESKPIQPESDVVEPVIQTAESEPMQLDSKAVESTVHVEDESLTDADGLPWDARIHAGSRERTATGTWRARRKPSEMSADQWAAYMDDVRDELRQLMAVPVTAQPELETVVPPIPVPAIIPPPPVAPANEPQTFQQVMMYLTGHAPKSDEERAALTEQINAVLATQGLTAIQQLMQRPDLIPQVMVGLREIFGE